MKHIHTCSPINTDKHTYTSNNKHKHTYMCTYLHPSLFSPTYTRAEPTKVHTHAQTNTQTSLHAK